MHQLLKLDFTQRWKFLLSLIGLHHSLLVVAYTTTVL